MEISTRKIIGFNVTCNPTRAWVKQQIREATAFGVQPRILIHDNDGIYGQFGKDRRSHLGYRSHLDYWLKETIGIRGIPITPGCPQETPHIERFNRTLREEALNHFGCSCVLQSPDRAEFTGCVAQERGKTTEDKG